MASETSKSTYRRIAFSHVFWHTDCRPPLAHRRHQINHLCRGSLTVVLTVEACGLLVGVELDPELHPNVSRPRKISPDEKCIHLRIRGLPLYDL